MRKITYSPGPPMAVQASSERVKLAPMVQQRGKPESRPFCAAVIPYPKINPLCLGQISTASAMNKALAGQKHKSQYFHVIRYALDRAY